MHLAQDAIELARRQAEVSRQRAEEAEDRLKIAIAGAAIAAPGIVLQALQPERAWRAGLALELIGGFFLFGSLSGLPKSW